MWLNGGSDEALACRAVLSRDEIARADRFAFEHLTRAYEIAHGALRLLLAGYLNTLPRAVEFTSGPRGKPELRDSPGLRFNMAHSEDMALYAFGSDCEVGIDVEAVREIPDLESIARRFFCNAEASELLSIEAPVARSEAFFRCWTRKEAYIKAVGEGLYLPLDEFQVTLLASDPAGFVHIGNDRAEAERWKLHHLDPAPAYIAALAYRGDRKGVTICEPVTASELLRL